MGRTDGIAWLPDGSWNCSGGGGEWLPNGGCANVGCGCGTCASGSCGCSCGGTGHLALAADPDGDLAMSASCGSCAGGSRTAAPAGAVSGAPSAASGRGSANGRSGADSGGGGDSWDVAVAGAALVTGPFSARQIAIMVSEAIRMSDMIGSGRISDKQAHCHLSCFLCAMFGPLNSIAIGLLKELFDEVRPGGSGFSWEDLEADVRGLDCCGTMGGASWWGARFLGAFAGAIQHCERCCGIQR